MALSTRLDAIVAEMLLLTDGEILLTQDIIGPIIDTTALDAVACRQRLMPFGEACYNDNTEEELVACLQQDVADATDCATWQVTPAEWRESIKGALIARVSNRVPNEYPF